LTARIHGTTPTREVRTERLRTVRKRERRKGGGEGGGFRCLKEEVSLRSGYLAGLDDGDGSEEEWTVEQSSKDQGPRRSLNLAGGRRRTLELSSRQDPQALTCPSTHLQQCVRVDSCSRLSWKCLLPHETDRGPPSLGCRPTAFSFGQPRSSPNPSSLLTFFKSPSAHISPSLTSAHH
jgi:hypothetical protein